MLYKLLILNEENTKMVYHESKHYDSSVITHFTDQPRKFWFSAFALIKWIKENRPNWKIIRTVTLTIHEDAIVELIDSDKTTSFVKWYISDFSDNGNINLPKKYKIKEREGTKLVLEEI